MSQYDRGRRLEYAVRNHLIRDGYRVMRGSSSKGFADLAGIKQGELVLISCKLTTPPGLAERTRLIETARMLTPLAVPLVALGPVAHPQYRRLTGPKPGQWEHWTPDQIADPT